MSPERIEATCQGPNRRLLTSFPALLLLALLAYPLSQVQAHFKLNLNVRILHIEHVADGLTVYLRMPMPYLLAGLTGPEGDDGLPIPAPYTSNTMEDGQVVHYFELDQFRADPHGLGKIAGDGLNIEAANGGLVPRVETVRIYRVGDQPGFANIDEARMSLGYETGADNIDQPLYVGDAVIDVMLHYKANERIRTYAISSTLNPGLPGQEDTANLILDYGPGNTLVFRARGLLDQPVEVSRSVLSAVTTFIKEGFRHILEGTDHVLFVLCLVLGAMQVGQLLWRVTGFTLGHSVTLTTGFLGFVPSGDWFIPAVETGIALSIIYAALVAIRPGNVESVGGDRRMFIITCAIGLLHGLGFSFVLHKILQVTSPDIWQSLLAFNIGIELGQLAIVLVTWPLFLLIRRIGERTWRYSRGALAVFCIAIASVWTVQRTLSILG